MLTVQLTRALRTDSLGGCLVNVPNGNARAQAGKLERQEPADAAPATSDHNDIPLEAPQIAVNIDATRNSKGNAQCQQLGPPAAQHTALVQRLRHHPRPPRRRPFAHRGSAIADRIVTDHVAIDHWVVYLVNR